MFHHSINRALRLALIPIIIAGWMATVTAGPRRDSLVSTSWLARRLGRPEVIILHIAADRKGYDEGHVPGARFVPLGEIVVARDQVPNELPPLENLHRLLTRLAVGDKARLILYGELNGLAATRTLFTLATLGHADRAAILDGGLERWKAENRPLEKEPPAFLPARFTPRPDPTLIVKLETMRDLSWVAANIEPNKVTIIDSRSAEVYAGAPEKKTGHIPGAINIYWMDGLQKDGTLKPLAELRRLYGVSGLTSDSAGRPRIAVYCNSGMQASHSWFTLRYLGFDSLLYDGSMGEWSRANGPVVSGRSRR